MFIEFDNLKDLLAFNIKYYRYCNNMSQEELAELSELHPKYFSDIERGVHSPTLIKIEKIAGALKIEPYILFKNIDRKKSIIDKMNDARQYNQNKK